MEEKMKESFTMEQMETETAEMTSLQYLNRDNAVFPAQRVVLSRWNMTGKHGSVYRLSVCFLLRNRIGFFLSAQWKRGQRR